MEKAASTMTMAGVGPRLVLVWLLLCAPIVVARLLWPEAVRITVVPRAVVIGVAAALLAVGVPFWIASVVRLARGFPRGELFTSGPYALCRHPLYASWVLFNVPGLVLLADNLAGLLLPVPMYLALRWMVRPEEEWLERTFGDAYREYRERVHAVLPVPRARR